MHWEVEYKQPPQITPRQQKLLLTSAIKQENTEETTSQEACVSAGQSPDLILGLTPSYMAPI